MLSLRRRLVTAALIVLASSGLLADKVLAVSLDGGDAPPSTQGLRIVPRSVVESSPALEKPTFLRCILVGVASLPVFNGLRDGSVRPRLRSAVELDAVLIAVALLTKYQPFQESLSSP